MKTLTIFYSYSGNTKKIAIALAQKEKTDILQIEEVKPFGKFKAYTLGIIAAIKGTGWPIKPFGYDLTNYDRFILLAPIWADNPAPPFNSLLAQLPPNKTVAIKMISASGKSDCQERLAVLLKEKSCILESFQDIKA